MWLLERFSFTIVPNILAPGVGAYGFLFFLLLNTSALPNSFASLSPNPLYDKSKLLHVSHFAMADISNFPSFMTLHPTKLQQKPRRHYSKSERQKEI
jgi:hypothetical protein